MKIPLLDRLPQPVAGQQKSPFGNSVPKCRSQFRKQLALLVSQAWDLNVDAVK